MKGVALALAVLVLALPGRAEVPGGGERADGRPVAEAGKRGRREVRRPGRVFSEWHPAGGATDGQENPWLEELRALVEAGRRDRAASPDFLDALERFLERHGGKLAVPPPDRLPMEADFRGTDWPAGWEAVDATVWRFGGGVAEQTRSWANTRFVLSYAPGKEWRDYSATFRCESEAWMTPPARSAAVLYFRYRGVDDTYSFWMDGAGDIALNSSEKGKPGRLLARVPVAPEIIRDGKPWTIKAKGEKIEAWHEGTCWLQVTDRAHPSGTVGMESVHIPMRFSGISVK